MAIGLERLRERTTSIVHNIGSLVIAALTLAAIVFGLGIAVNPFITDDPVGGPVINLILLGYGLPALLAGVLALVTRGVRPQAYSTTAAIVAVGLAPSYLSLQVARFYHGPVSDGRPDHRCRAIHLLGGVAGVRRAAARRRFFLRSRSVRFASAAVVGLTVAKVFLVDMSDLTGIYRALVLHRPGHRADGDRLAVSALAASRTSGSASSTGWRTAVARRATASGLRFKRDPLKSTTSKPFMYIFSRTFPLPENL